MKRTDINQRYRMCAVYCAVQGRKNEGKNHISWDSLEARFGINWESLTNELKVKGILYGASGYMYLTPQFAALTATEQMDEIMRLYPRNAR